MRRLAIVGPSIMLDARRDKAQDDGIGPWLLPLLLCMLGSLLAIIFIMVPDLGEAETVHWNDTDIDDGITLAGLDVQLDGNLTIDSSGILSLHNCTLYI